MTLRNLAVKNNQINAAISAEIARGKAAGVSTDRVETTIKTGYSFKVERATRDN